MSSGDAAPLAEACGGSTMFEVTHISTARLQHVVVPIAAQQMSGRRSWSSTVSVRCVAGQQIAVGGQSSVSARRTEQPGTYLGARKGE